MNVRDGFVGSIGNTPLIRLRGASELTGCNILGKAEFLNPGGSVKDRAGLYIILDAEKRGLLKAGGLIVEGTAGNTGIGLALVGNARGYRTLIVIPETQSKEKKDMLRLCGAELREVPAVPYKDPNNYVHVSERVAKEMGAFWANQWDNTANRDGHFRSTGGDLGANAGQGRRLHLLNRDWRHAFRSRFVFEEAEQQSPRCRRRPDGRGDVSLVQNGELKSRQLDHRRHRPGPRHQNIEGAPVDDAYETPDSEALPVIFDLLKKKAFA
jgi:cysteine synthase A